MFITVGLSMLFNIECNNISDVLMFGIKRMLIYLFQNYLLKFMGAMNETRNYQAVSFYPALTKCHSVMNIHASTYSGLF